MGQLQEAQRLHGRRDRGARGDVGDPDGQRPFPASHQRSDRGRNGRWHRHRAPGRAVPFHQRPPCCGTHSTTNRAHRVAKKGNLAYARPQPAGPAGHVDTAQGGPGHSPGLPRGRLCPRRGEGRRGGRQIRGSWRGQRWNGRRSVADFEASPGRATPVSWQMVRSTEKSSNGSAERAPAGVDADITMSGT